MLIEYKWNRYINKVRSGVLCFSVTLNDHIIRRVTSYSVKIVNESRYLRNVSLQHLCVFVKIYFHSTFIYFSNFENLFR